MGSPNSIEARIKNFSKTFFTPLPASFDEFLKSKIHQVFSILYFFGKTIYNNHENTPVKQAMPRDMRKKESTKLKYGFRVFAISCFRDVFLVTKIKKGRSFKIKWNALF